MLLRRTGRTQSLRPSTARRRKRKKTRAASIPGAAPARPGAIPHTGPPGALTQAARTLPQTGAATADSAATLTTATVTTATGLEGTPSVPMTPTTPTTPAPSTGPNGTNTRPQTTTIASAAARPEAAPGVTAGGARGRGAAAAAAVAAAAGASAEAAAPRPTAGSGAEATAETAAAAPGALPRGRVPGRAPGVTKAPRRGVPAVETSSAQKSTAPSLPTISEQAGGKVLARRRMAEEMMAKGQAHPPRTAVLVQDGGQKVTAAPKTRTPSLPSCYWRRSSQGKWRGKPV